MEAFLKQKHIDYVKLQEEHRLYEYWLSEHLRMNGIYWGIMALATMDELSALPRAEVEKFVLSCWDDKYKAFGAFPGHDAHILSTLSGLQILKIYDSELKQLTDEQKQGLIKFIEGLQLSDGSFQGDRFGEVDTRFVYTALQALLLLGALTKSVVDPSVEFIMRCQNFDGGFGMAPGSESHAAQVFVCVAALAVVDRLDLVVDDAKLAAWLSERQLPLGGFNGRPEKLEDVCYLWWVLLLLAIIDKKHWVDLKKLQSFILSCQDPEKGGFSDRPDNQTDIYHTCFSITGLALTDAPGFIKIDPIFCLPCEVTMGMIKWKE